MRNRAGEQRHRNSTGHEARKKDRQGDGPSARGGAPGRSLHISERSERPRRGICLGGKRARTAGTRFHQARLKSDRIEQICGERTIGPGRTPMLRHIRHRPIPPRQSLVYRAMVHQRTLMPKRRPDHAAHCLLFGAKPPQERHAALGWSQPTIGAPRRALISTARTTSNVLLPSALRRPIGGASYRAVAALADAIEREVRRHACRAAAPSLSISRLNSGSCTPAPAPLDLLRGNGEPEPLLQRPRERAAHCVRLPAGRLDDLGDRRALRPAAAWRSTAPASSPRGPCPYGALCGPLAAPWPLRDRGFARRHRGSRTRLWACRWLPVPKPRTLPYRAASPEQFRHELLAEFDHSVDGRR